MNTIRKDFCAIHFRARSSVTADRKICAGCKTCEIICSLTHEGAVDLSRSRIYVKSNPFRGSFIPMVCRQCTDAPCYYACPESAITIHPDTGIVLIDEDTCNGCRSCEEACPFNAIRFDPVKEKAFKCDMCGGSPECVDWCPMNALGISKFGGSVPK